jgi:hypothetical protein
LCSNEYAGRYYAVNDNKESLSAALPLPPAERFPSTARTIAIEQQVMPRNAKTARWPRQDGAGTAAELIHPATFAAVKMVMVRLACHLVTSGLARQRDGFKPALLQQRLDIAVYSRDPQSFVMMLARDKSFFRREWPIRLDKGVTNGLFLTCIAWNRLRHVCLMITTFQFHL